MIEKYKLESGIFFLLVGITALYIVIKENNLKEDNIRRNSMFFKGLVGGVAFIILGIVLLFQHFNN